MTDTSDQVVFPLKKPIEQDGKTYTSLTFNEATAGDLALADSITGELTKTLAILAGMADVSIHVIKKIKASDLKALNEKVAPLMGEAVTLGQGTGPTS